MSEFVLVKRDQVQRWLDDMGLEKYETAPSLIRRREELCAVLAQEACTSCDGSGEYIDAIGDWRGYCSCPVGVELKNRPAPIGRVSYIGNGFIRARCIAPPALETLLYTSPPALVAVVMSFDFQHPISKERMSITLTKQDVFDGMEDYFYDKLGEQICQCESVGETNVVDCNCDEYVHDFEIVDACLQKVKELNQ